MKLDEKALRKKSKWLSLILRHKPEAANITLDKNGWSQVNEVLISGGLTHTQLEQIVYENNKQRFEFDETQKRIRARQGHSIEVDVELTNVTPPSILYHGTSFSALTSIWMSGIEKRKRLHVHLTNETKVAEQVGSRYGVPIVLVIDAFQMHKDGRKFFLSNNGVYLTEYVPVKYITRSYQKVN